jgi:hypothetical protein
MKLRTLVITVAILAALSAVAYFLNRPTPPPSADARVGQPLVDTAIVEKSATITLSDQGKTVTVAREADGIWRVATYFDLPADFEKLSRFTGELTEAHLKRLVTSNPERIARLEFKDSRIDLLDASGQEQWSVLLGRTADSGGRYVRFGEEQKAFLADLNVWLDAESKNWADSRLLTLKPEDVAAIEIPLADGATIKASRAKKDDAWSAEPAPTGQKLKADRITSALSSLTGLRFTDTVDPTDPNATTAKQHLRTFKLTTFDGKTISVALGRKPEEKKLKPPAPSTDGKSGPAALGSISELAKTAPTSESPNSDAAEKPAEAAGPKPLTPEYETIPAGPVFAFITHSDTTAPINALMQKRTFQIGDYVFTGLPQNASELFEAAPPPAPSTPPAPAKDSNATAAPAPAG